MFRIAVKAQTGFGPVDKHSNGWLLAEGSAIGPNPFWLKLLFKRLGEKQGCKTDQTVMLG